MFARLINASFPLLPGCGTDQEGFWGPCEQVLSLVEAQMTACYEKGISFAGTVLLTPTVESISVPVGREKSYHRPEWDDGEVFARPAETPVSISADEFFCRMRGIRDRISGARSEWMETPEEIYYNIL